jgi:Flp pilus assembly protein TadG
MKTASAKSRRASRPGAAVVEFAVVAPLLFLLLFGIIEFARAMMVVGLVANSARAGARAGVVAYANYDTIVNTARTNLDRAGIAAPATIEVRVDGTRVNNNAEFQAAVHVDSAIEVSVAVPYDQVSWSPGRSWYLGGLSLYQASSMRREGP